VPAAKRVSDDEVVAAYEQYGHLGQAAASVGIHKSSLHGRLVKLGISTARARAWAPADDELLRAEYARHRMAGRVRDLAETADRTVGAVTQRAYSLGLTDVRGREALVPDVIERSAYTRSRDERYRAAEMLLGLGGLDYRSEQYVLAGDPMSKARSRFTKGGNTYTPASVREAEGRWIRRLADAKKYTGNVAVGCIFVRADGQRIDVDNMVKLVLDACTGAGVWMDDSQVTAIAAVEEFDPLEPRTILALMPHASTMLRGTAHWPSCPTCGEQFNPSGRKRPVFCSRACRTNRPIPPTDQLALDRSVS
jgi:Holliday junction resolvase RusA-like endonuclease